MIESIQTADDNGARLRAHLTDEAATVTFGAALARVLAPGLQIWLQGNLGTGSISTVLAGVVISMIPALVVFIFGQKPLREGLTAGAGK